MAFDRPVRSNRARIIVAIGGTIVIEVFPVHRKCLLLTYET